MSPRRRRILVKAVVWAVCLLPAALLAVEGLTGRLGANPIEEITHRTGWWALVLLTTTLAVTPVRRLTRRNGLVRYRRLVGLFAFFYATLHFLTYLVVDQFFAWTYILEDIVDRPFITVGFASWVILVVLAATSTRRSIRRLGRRWQRLHRLVYAAAVLGGVHYFWKVKADTREPLIFLGIIAVLLVARPVLKARRGKQGGVERSPGGVRRSLRSAEVQATREAPDR